MVNHQSFQLSAEELPHQTQEYLETLFAVGNGQIGVRGAPAEGESILSWKSWCLCEWFF